MVIITGRIKDYIVKTFSVQQQGHEAEKILGNPIVKVAFENLEEQVTEAWKNSRSFKEREALWSSFRYLQAFKKELKDFIILAEVETYNKEQQKGELYE